MLEVVGGKRAILGRERRTMLVRQLLRVEADAQTVVRGSLEDALHLIGSEGDGFAERVDTGCEPLFRRSRNELVDDLANVVRATILAAGWQSVKREQRRHDANCFALTELASDLHQPQLALDIEAVARLDLNRRTPTPHQGVQTSPALVEQFLV